MDSLFALEVKEQETGHVVFTRRDIPGRTLMELMRLFEQMQTVGSGVTQAKESISRIADEIRRIGNLFGPREEQRK